MAAWLDGSVVEELKSSTVKGRHVRLAILMASNQAFGYSPFGVSVWV